MAFELVEEVLDHAPPMSPAERLALVVIAEAARKGTRAAVIPQDVLIRRMGGLGERGLRKVFERLERTGIKVRVPLGLNNNGRPFYALPGKACSFILPDFPAPEDCVCHRCKAKEPQFRQENPKEPQFPGEEPQFPVGELQGTGEELEFRPSRPERPLGLSPDRSENRRALRDAPAVHPKADLISSMRLNALDASRKKRAKANGTPTPFGALMNYQVDTEAGEAPDAQTPEL